MIRSVDQLDEILDIVDAAETAVVELGASWCGPCRAFLPHFTEFSKRHEDVACIKVDIDVDDAVVSHYKIQSVPQVLLYQNGEYVKHLDARTVIALEKEIGL